ncbi:MAG: mechanosensitive ion channel family protein [Reinekea sp.]|nr:mechanosensitive ion channel family protein [Reinekea sp.]MDX1472535.1 mechanosensitive ion channel family protein [Reinekea sp.]
MNPYVELLIFIAIAILIRGFVLKMVGRLGEEKQVDERRLFYVKKAIDSVIVTLCVLIIFSVSGLGINDLGVFLGSVIAVLGVALFAQWSILSNATASVIVFFFFPYRVGDEVKILDGDNSIAGTIKEIALFHVILSDEQGDIITFPNSMVFQKAVVIKKGKTQNNEEDEDHNE